MKVSICFLLILAMVISVILTIMADMIESYIKEKKRKKLEKMRIKEELERQATEFFLIYISTLWKEWYNEFRNA